MYPKINNISKSFGEHKVLQDLNIQIDKGKIYTVVGGNETGHNLTDKRV